MKALYITSGTKIEHFPKDYLSEFVFFGRSNVGKSSFINTLLNQVIARTSSKPGKTQTINFFLIDDNYYFVDVPGYGYANVSKTKRDSFGEMIEEYITKRTQLKRAFLLVDFRHKPTEDDCLMYNFLNFHQIKITVIATKKDKVKRSLFSTNKQQIIQTLNLHENDLIITSAETKEGIDLVLNKIKEELN